jgi:adenylate cyclase
VEEFIYILMADLSGYSAMTEAHGALYAADLIDKYESIVRKSLVGDCILTERTGDQVMIVSRSSESILATATLIIKATSGEEKFLQVHGGLHCGNVVIRNNSYYGSAINITSRIAAKSDAGTFWCSNAFAQTLSSRSSTYLRNMGMHPLKNILEETEIFQLVIGETESFLIDPVCRMLILNRENAIVHPDNNDIYFCSSKCLEIFISKQL